MTYKKSFGFLIFWKDSGISSYYFLSLILPFSVLTLSIMKEIIFHPEPFDTQIQDVPIPTPSDDDILLKVKAAGTNPKGKALLWQSKALQICRDSGPFLSRGLTFLLFGILAQC